MLDKSLNFSAEYSLHFKPVGQCWLKLRGSILTFLNSYKYLFTLIDRFSRFLFTFPQKNKNLFNYGINFQRILVLNRRDKNCYIQSTSELFKSICDNQSSHHNFTSNYTPASHYNVVLIDNPILLEQVNYYCYFVQKLPN